jgi:hypothetical protein
VEIGKNKHGITQKVTTLGLASSLVLSSNLLAEPASAAAPDVSASISGPYCMNKQNTFDYSVKNNNNSSATNVSIELNDSEVSSVYLFPLDSYLGKVATDLAVGQNYKLEILADGQIVGQPLEGSAINCNIEKITPATPTFNERSGSDKDSVTIPDQQGVGYTINGNPVGSGEKFVQGNVVVNALPLEGYVFNDGTVQAWSYNFTSELSDEDIANTLPPFVAPVGPFSIIPNKKIPKKHQKQCKSIINTRDLAYFNPYSKKSRKITKAENIILKKKCKVKKPKILLSDQNTKVFDKTPINWGERPYTIGSNGDVVYVSDIDQAIFDKNNGKLKAINGVNDAYYGEISRFLPKSKKVEQPQPLTKNKIRKSEVVDFTADVRANNDTNQNKVLTVGIRTMGKNPATIVEDNVLIKPNCSQHIVIRDSAGLPPSNSMIGEVPQPGCPDTLVVEPSQQDSIKYRNVKKAVLYYGLRDLNTGETEEYYQRSSLIGVRPKVPKGTKDSAPSYRVQQNFYRNW